MKERVRRREKRDWRFVRPEKTSFPKTESPLDCKFLKMKKELIVDKFRTEYFNKLDRYNLNNILHLKDVKIKKNFPTKN